MTTTFSGGIQLANNIQVLTYKNDVQHWLSLYKDDKFIDFVAYGSEISGLTASSDGMWFAYFQKNAAKDMLDFSVWKYERLSESEHEIVPYCELLVSAEFPCVHACFNTAGTHVACLSEWNRMYVVDLRRLDAPTEFYIPNGCDEVMPQVIYDVGNCFVWFGQDEYVRVIDLTATTLSMWRYKMKRTKYLFVHNNHIVHMTDNGVIGIYRTNLREKRLEICYDINYPTGNYEDITIDEFGRIKFHKKGGKQYTIDL